MIALNMLEVKECMSKLLVKDNFDRFTFIEGEITTFISFKIDGFLKREFFDTTELESIDRANMLYPLWEHTKPYCFNLIKGKKTPNSFKFVLNYSKEDTLNLLSTKLPHIDPLTVNGLFLRFNYENGKLECCTGTSISTFSLDKSVEHVWDDTCKAFLKQQELLFEEL